MTTEAEFTHEEIALKLSLAQRATMLDAEAARELLKISLQLFTKNQELENYLMSLMILSPL